MEQTEDNLQSDSTPRYSDAYSKGAGTRKLQRRMYMSRGLNAVWQIGGYDKLKPHCLPVHGCVDGFSRRIA